MHKIKIVSAFIGILVVILVILLIRDRNIAQAPVVSEGQQKQMEFDPKNATYDIDGNSYTLVDGLSEVDIEPGSYSKVTTRYFGNEAKGDLNGDGKDDLAFLLMQDGGGTGVFFYAVAALSTQDGFKTSNAFYIGDRIAPQTTNIMNGEIWVNYADREPGEPMAAMPSLGVTKYLKVENNELVEVESLK